MKKEFIINENGVCINPNRVEYGDNKWGYVIKTAKIDGKWYFAYDCYHPNGGCGCGVSADKTYKAFNSEHEAISAASTKVHNYFSRGFYSAYDKKDFAPPKLIQSLKQLRKPVQLTLFDL